MMSSLANGSLSRERESKLTIRSSSGKQQHVFPLPYTFSLEDHARLQSRDGLHKEFYPPGRDHRPLLPTGPRSLTAEVAAVRF